MGIDCTKTVFVVGVVRSGTSLLYSVINQHPSVALMYECDAWSFPKFFSRKRFQGRWLERLEFYNNALSRHRLNFGGGTKGLETVEAPGDLYSIYGELKDASICGEKSPFYCTRLEDLFDQYPGCSFIIIWRDPVEICQSVTTAGKRSQFFRRRGMLSRLIFYHESMIRQSRLMEAAGARVYHLTYDELVSDTERVCRDICAFLKLEFNASMLDISSGDFSPIFKEEHHANLLKGSIQRQRSEKLKLPDSVYEKLRRFQTRWKRLAGEWVAYPAPERPAPEPQWFELLWHNIAGRWFYFFDSTKRVVFEFFPISWLRSYRKAKRWYLATERMQTDSRRSSWEDLKINWKKVLSAYALLMGVISLDILTGPTATVIPFYLIPITWVTLSTGRRWGLQLAMISAIAITLVQGTELSIYSSWKLEVWNGFMRFCLFQIFVFLLNRVHLEYLRSPEARENPDSPVM